MALRSSRNCTIILFFTNFDVQILQSPFLGLTAKAKLFCTKCDKSPEVSSDEKPLKKLKKSSLNMEDKCKISDNLLQRSSSDPTLSIEHREKLSNSYLTSTPAHALRCECSSNVVFTPQDHERKSMSPITRSTQRMPKAMQVRFSFKLLLVCA